MYKHAVEFRAADVDSEIETIELIRPIRKKLENGEKIDKEGRYELLASPHPGFPGNRNSGPLEWGCRGAGFQGRQESNSERWEIIPESPGSGAGMGASEGGAGTRGG